MLPLDVTGFFWLPGSEQVRQHGRLVFDPKDGTTLHLSDALATKRADGVLVERGGGSYERILGLIQEPHHNRPLTLIDCGWLNRKKYYANTILIGGHLEDDESTVFESVIVRLRDAAPWVDKDAVTVDVDSALEGVDRREMVCKLDRPPRSEASFSRGRVTVDFRWSREDVELESFKVNQWPEFVIEYDEMTPLASIYGDASHLYNLSSLCNDRADSFDSICVYRSDYPEMLLSGKPIEGTRRRIELKARLGDPTQRKEAKRLSAHDVLVPFDDLGGIQAVATWLDRAPTLAPIVGSLTTMRSDGIYSENRFLNICSAAEGLHRATVGGSYLPPAEFKRLRRQIREDGVPPEHRAWFVDVMAHANDPSLDRRLRELASEVPGVIDTLVGPDVDAWIRAVKKVRNNLTHLDEGREAFDGGDLHWLAESLFHVTRLCLLRRIGLVDDHLHKIARSVRMQGTLDYVVKAVAHVAGTRSATELAGETE